MALYRTVSLSFWTDSKVTDDFTPQDRYFFLYLMTNPHTNLSGCYEISIKQISNETGYDSKKIENLFERFTNVLKIAVYSKSTKEVLILNWHRYNWTSSEKFRKPLYKEIEAVKCEDFKKYLIDVFDGVDSKRYPIDTNCIDTNCIDTNCIDTPVTVTDTVTDTDIKKTKKVKHKYGTYQNVLLSDEDMEKLKVEFPADYKDRIERVSMYCKSKGKSYSDYLATIRNWARKENNGSGIQEVSRADEEQLKAEHDKYINSDEYKRLVGTAEDMPFV